MFVPYKILQQILCYDMCEVIISYLNFEKPDLTDINCNIRMVGQAMLAQSLLISKYKVYSIRQIAKNSYDYNRLLLGKLYNQDRDISIAWSMKNYNRSTNSKQDINTLLFLGKTIQDLNT